MCGGYMNIKTGIDIIEIDRIKESIESTEGKFCEKVYTKNEIEYCESKKSQRYQHYAVRFSAKEAVFKAISSNLQNKYDISWKDIEILNDDNGRPYVNMPKRFMEEIEDIDLSISHCKQYAVASVVIMLN
jgi:holo-[acyl-carrier protein] synthase